MWYKQRILFFEHKRLENTKNMFAVLKLTLIWTGRTNMFFPLIMYITIKSVWKLKKKKTTCPWQNRSCCIWEVLSTQGKPTTKDWGDKFLLPLPQDGISFVLQLRQIKLHLRQSEDLQLHLHMKTLYRSPLCHSSFFM